MSTRWPRSWRPRACGGETKEAGRLGLVVARWGVGMWGDSVGRGARVRVGCLVGLEAGELVWCEAAHVYNKQ